ncbi:MAG: cytosolic protein [Nitrospirae bacterium]|nr:cytosolic protein [Nitrospirota bacterium]
MECNQAENKARCNCTYEPCSRKGICCQCLAYHLPNKELPACAFPPEKERTYNRSFQAFIDAHSK